VFVMTDPSGDAGDEVIEFMPGGKTECAKPSGEVTVHGTETDAATVTQGEEVTFDAQSIKRAGETPFAFEWNLEEKGWEGSQMEVATEDNWPSPELKHAYLESGTYHAVLRMFGDYGESEFPFTVKVNPTAEVKKPEFECAAEKGLKAKCDASTWEGPPGSEIVGYHWVFGDGTAKTSTGPEEGHVYQAAGTYPVTLTIIYEARPGHQEEEESPPSTPKTVTVAEASCTSECGGGSGGGGSGGGGSGGGSSGGGNTTSGGSTGGLVSSTPGTNTGVLSAVVKKPTRAELLARALKSCRKIKAKHRRSGCEALARKKYGPPRKHKGQSKK
jgi:hypothetical protein